MTNFEALKLALHKQALRTVEREGTQAARRALRTWRSRDLDEVFARHARLNSKRWER